MSFFLGGWLKDDVRFGSKADLMATNANVRFVPEADICVFRAFSGRLAHYWIQKKCPKLR